MALKWSVCWLPRRVTERQTGAGVVDDFCSELEINRWLLLESNRKAVAKLERCIESKTPHK